MIFPRIIPAIIGWAIVYFLLSWAFGAVLILLLLRGSHIVNQPSQDAPKQITKTK